jgi:hypothetical protein
MGTRENEEAEMHSGSEFTPEECRQIVAASRQCEAVTLAAERLQRYETSHPGTILAFASMDRDAQDDFLHPIIGQFHPVLVCEDRRWLFRERDAELPSFYAEVHPTPGAPAVPLTPNGHCPRGSECEPCQYEDMTPAEREAWHAWSAAELARRPRPRRNPGPAQPPQEEELADWERELLESA